MSDPGNTWTDERVEQLRKLWSEGLSASQIATEIGGVTRNAVIGKVHRLGLSGRTKTPATATTARSVRKAPASAPQAAAAAAPVARPAEPQILSTSVSAPASTPAPRPLATAFNNASLADVALEDDLDDGAVQIIPSSREDVVVPLSERVTIMDLREYMCRWPIGDPTSPSFRFCGARSTTGMPYCAHHASIAYQPIIDRRRDRKRA